MKHNFMKRMTAGAMVLLMSATSFPGSVYANESNKMNVTTNSQSSTTRLRIMSDPAVSISFPDISSKDDLITSSEDSNTEITETSKREFTWLYKKESDDNSDKEKSEFDEITSKTIEQIKSTDDVSKKKEENLKGSYADYDSGENLTFHFDVDSDYKITEIKISKDATTWNDKTIVYQTQEEADEKDNKTSEISEIEDDSIDKTDESDDINENQFTLSNGTLINVIFDSYLEDKVLFYEDDGDFTITPKEVNSDSTGIVVSINGEKIEQEDEIDTYEDIDISTDNIPDTADNETITDDSNEATKEESSKGTKNNEWHSMTLEELKKERGIDLSECLATDNEISLQSTYTLTKNGTMSNGGMSGSRFRVNGQQAYCLIPSLYGPEGSFEWQDIDATSSEWAQMIGKIMYYGYGGNGDIVSGSSDYSGYDAEMLTHCTLAFAWQLFGKTTLQWTVGTGGGTLTSEYINAAQKLYLSIQGKPAVKGTLHITFLSQSTGTYQDIVFASITPITNTDLNETKYITISKVDQTGSPVKGATFAVYGFNHSTGKYDRLVSYKASDEEGVIRFDISTNATDNGLFLVKETNIPSGYEKGTISYLNDADKSDFENVNLGGRLYYAGGSNVDRLIPYRDTRMMTIGDSSDVLAKSGSRTVYDGYGKIIRDDWGCDTSNLYQASCWGGNVSAYGEVKDMEYRYNGWYRASWNFTDFTSFATSGTVRLATRGYKISSTRGDNKTNLTDRYITCSKFPYSTLISSKKYGDINIEIYQNKSNKGITYRVVNTTTSSVSFNINLTSTNGKMKNISGTLNNFQEYLDTELVQKSDAVGSNNFAWITEDVSINGKHAAPQNNDKRVWTADYLDTHYTNNRLTTTISTLKTDENGNALGGATFTVYGYNSATGSYDREAGSFTTNDSRGYGSTDVNIKSTDNGLFLVKETSAPTGYDLPTEDTYDALNDADLNDFKVYGGRLYYYFSGSNECTAYRGDSLRILAEGIQNSISYRFVQAYDGHIVTDVWGADSTYTTTFWTDYYQLNQGTYVDGNLMNTDSNGNKWYRSLLDINHINRYLQTGSLTAPFTETGYITIKKTGSAADYFIANVTGSIYWYPFQLVTSSDEVNGISYDVYRKINDDNKYFVRVKNSTTATKSVTYHIWNLISENPTSISSKTVSIGAGSSVDTTFDLASTATSLAALCIYDQTNNRFVTLNFPERTGQTFVNTKQVIDRTASLSFTKVSASDQSELSGAVFTVYKLDSDNNWISTGLTATSDEDGKTEFSKISYSQHTTNGCFAVKETTAPNGYVLDNDYRYFKIMEDDTVKQYTDDTFSEEMIQIDGFWTNEAVWQDTASLTITKENALGKKLAGATFILEKNEGDATTAKWTQISTGETDDDGSVTLYTNGQESYLKVYRVKEISAPNGYNVDSVYRYYIALEDGTMVQVEAPENDESANISTTETQTNDKIWVDEAWKGSIEFKKVSTYLTSSTISLPGAVFTLYVMNDNGNWEKAKIDGEDVTSISGSDGMVHFDLDYAMTTDGKFMVMETTAPKGFLLSNESRYYKLTADNTVTEYSDNDCTSIKGNQNSEWDNNVYNSVTFVIRKTINTSDYYLEHGELTFTFKVKGEGNYDQSIWGEPDEYTIEFTFDEDLYRKAVAKGASTMTIEKEITVKRDIYSVTEKDVQRFKLTKVTDYKDIISQTSNANNAENCVTASISYDSTKGKNGITPLTNVVAKVDLTNENYNIGGLCFVNEREIWSDWSHQTNKTNKVFETFKKLG